MPSDMGEMFNTRRAGRKALRAALGAPCPRCREKRPKAQPSILLPNQACKVDGYIDPRPHTTREQRNAVYAAAGIALVELAPIKIDGVEDLDRIDGQLEDREREG